MYWEFQAFAVLCISSLGACLEAHVASERLNSSSVYMLDLVGSGIYNTLSCLDLQVSVQCYRCFSDCQINHSPPARAD